jgi:hypothetical protein
VGFRAAIWVSSPIPDTAWSPILTGRPKIIRHSYCFIEIMKATCLQNGSLAGLP